MLEYEKNKKLRDKGIVVDHMDDLLIPINNRPVDEDTLEATTLEGALDILSLTSGDNIPDEHPEKRRKALYEKYYAQQLPILQEEHPGLKLSQYKERIFESWQKSPDNPVNQAKVNALKTEKDNFKAQG